MPSIPWFPALITGAAVLYAVYTFTTSKDEIQVEQRNQAIRREALGIDQLRREAIRREEISRREEERRLEELSRDEPQEEQRNQAIRRETARREALRREALGIDQPRCEVIRREEISRREERRLEELRQIQARNRAEAAVRQNAAATIAARRSARPFTTLVSERSQVPPSPDDQQTWPLASQPPSVIYSIRPLPQTSSREEERRLEELRQIQARNRAEAAARQNAAATIAARRSARPFTTLVSERSQVPPSPDDQQTWPLASQPPSVIHSIRPLPQTSSNDREAYQGSTERQPVSPPLPRNRRVSVIKQDRDINIVEYTGHDLRIEARKERDAMVKCQDEAKAARLRKATVDARIYSNQAQRHRSEMQRLDGEASELIYIEKNRGLKTGLIDLHGLYVKEAIQRTAEAVKAAVERGDSEIKIIVGKGNNSTGLVPRLKPAVEKWLSLHQYSTKLDSDGGRFVVDLQSRGDQEGSSDEVSDISNGSEDSCDDYL